MCIVFFQAEDGIRDLVRSRGLGDVYKRQLMGRAVDRNLVRRQAREAFRTVRVYLPAYDMVLRCLLYTSDAADERSSVDLGGRRIIKKKKKDIIRSDLYVPNNSKVLLEEVETDEKDQK